MKRLHVFLLFSGAAITLLQLVRFTLEYSGVLRANTFGYIQISLTTIGLLLLAAGFTITPGARNNNFRYLNWLLICLFSILMLMRIPQMWKEAGQADIEADHKISTYGDDVEYQVSALNILYGHGFSPAFALPLETYRLDLNTSYGRDIIDYYNTNSPKLSNAESRFYRPPGYSYMLAASYALFGPETLVARRLTVVLAIPAAFLLLAMGAILGGWIGILAGGLAGLYHLYYFPGLYGFKYILTETPSALFIICFCFFFSLFQKYNKPLYLYLSAFCFTLLGLTRPNFYLVFPLLLVYLYFIPKISIRTLAIFSLVMIIPAAIWSAYATISLGKIALITTQGGTLFPPHNNIDVLEGIGPEHSGQGGPQYGRVEDANGRLLYNRHDVQPGENGWEKGLAFWFQNFEELPRLFYVKLRRGFFYDNHWSINIIHPEGLYIIGLGFLLFTVGLRPPQNKMRLFKKLTQNQVIILQIGLICMLILIWNQVAFWLVSIIWLSLLFIAVKRPYGDAFSLAFPNPEFFLTTIICHFITTILYQGYRYHWPLDPMLIFYSFLGIFITLFELFKNRLWYGLLFFLVIFVSLVLHFFEIGI